MEGAPAAVAAVGAAAALQEQDPDGAFRILTGVLRAWPHHVGALVELGLCHLHGRGTPVDVDLAFDAFKKAAELSQHPDACYYQARIMLGRSRDDDLAAMEVLMPAVDVHFQGRPSRTAAGALFLWGKCLAEGRGMDVDETEAEFFVREALRVRPNYPECQDYLGELIKRRKGQQRKRKRHLSDNDDACVPCIR